MEPIYLDEEFKAMWRYALDQAKTDRERYFNWIKEEINIAIKLINKYDKIYILGALGAKLIAASPTLYNQMLEDYRGEDQEHADREKLIPNDEIEVLLEYALNIASASENENKNVVPNEEEINEIIEQLSKIKMNIGFYEMSADNPKGGNEFDHWLKITVMEDAMHVRGDGYQSHISEVYEETFKPHDDFLNRYYGFTSKDIFNIIKRFDVLVSSKIGNAFGSALAHQRFMEWSEQNNQEMVIEKMIATGKHFIQQFMEDNLDLYDERNPETLSLLPLDYIEGYNRLFWVIPQGEKEEKIFKLFSHEFGDNKPFLEGKFGGFILGDTVAQTKPLVKYEEKYYCFSLSLPFRNIFNITAGLLQLADNVYYEHSFKGNSFSGSRDNYIERKSKELFEKLLPSVKFYHSLKYNIIEDDMPKEPELDILGVGNEALYIIEVKAGELNKKHRRGAILGLKDRLRDTVNEGSYQCYRAENYIVKNESPEFRYVADGKQNTLAIDKTKPYRYVKISVMFEHLSAVSVNLAYLIKTGVLSDSYKWTWIISLYDLMIFSDLIDTEDDFKKYLDNRIALYERDDIEFEDEIDILGYLFENNFRLPEKNNEEKIFIKSYRDEIDKYYNKKDVGMCGLQKPAKKGG
ncbi:hypothetical protein LRS05_09585 [Flavobacterium sp. J372]|uniref:hypothetical protein n=1 Tax=Flavobacterium sp. J372 TaxID=2898436 RepID=UPI002151BE4B|nr:hypothetical protein [Flavobacterium sp. J372]MCR5862382.1 hypothetical protein [Flavobacterium sp. J372]